MLSDLHLKSFLQEGMKQVIDAVLAAPVGLPPTGLYGLIDLIGLDVMELVGKNSVACLKLTPVTDTPVFTTEQRMLTVDNWEKKLEAASTGRRNLRMVKESKKALISLMKLGDPQMPRI